MQILCCTLPFCVLITRSRRRPAQLKSQWSTAQSLIAAALGTLASPSTESGQADLIHFRSMYDSSSLFFFFSFMLYKTILLYTFSEIKLNFLQKSWLVCLAVDEMVLQWHGTIWCRLLSDMFSIFVGSYKSLASACKLGYSEPVRKPGNREGCGWQEGHLA